MTFTIGGVASTTTDLIEKPIVSGIVHSLGNKASRVTDGVECVTHVLENKGCEVSSKVLDTAKQGHEIAHIMKDATGEMTNQVVQGAVHVTKDVAGDVVNKVQGATSEITNQVQGAVHATEDVVGDMTDKIQEVTCKVANIEHGVASLLGSTARNMGGGVIHLANGVTGAMDGLIGIAGGGFSEMINAMGDITGKMSDMIVQNIGSLKIIVFITNAVVPLTMNAVRTATSIATTVVKTIEPFTIAIRPIVVPFATNVIQGIINTTKFAIDRIKF